MYKVSVPQKNLTLIAPAGKNLMDLLMENQIPVGSTCHGDGICSKCCMQVSPTGQQSELEIKTLTRNKLDLTYRLSCQYFINEDISVTTGYW